ncbi:MAG: M23 family metallopeptidase [Myxococcaceae bacterium]|nr:M23 family metallopeptidase [Myxococcaceae bacterium]
MRWCLVMLLVPALCLAEDRCVQVTQTNVPDGIDLWARLTKCTEATITISADELTNVTNAVPATVDAAGRTRFRVAAWRRADPGKPWRVRDWRFRFKLGRRHPGPVRVQTWRRPFEVDARVLQRPFGTFSHGAGSQNEEAWDWAMSEGTPVLAARDGVVVAVRDDCTEGGPDEALRNDSNYVILRHDDGTFSEYQHLRHLGVRVRLGVNVAAGSVLGESGHTGFSSEPHLHFSVFHTLDGETRRSLPVTFVDETTASSEDTPGELEGAPGGRAREPMTRPERGSRSKRSRAVQEAVDAINALDP